MGRKHVSNIFRDIIFYMKKVLLIKLSSLGDVIFTIPLANNLKANGYEVHWLTTEKGIDIVKGNPCADKVFFAPLYTWRKNKFNLKYLFSMIKLISDLRKEHYDIAFDCQRRIKSLPFMRFCGAKRRIISNYSSEGASLGANEITPPCEGGLHMVNWNLDYAKYLGLDISNIKMSLPEQSMETKNKADELLKDVDFSKPVVIIAPATTWIPKHWAVDNWIKVIESLKDRCTLIFTGMEQDKKLISLIGGDKFINLAGKTNLNDLMEIFSRVQLVIAPDSGSAHLAWAAAKPALIEVFCCTATNLFGCFGDENKYFALSGNLSCQPCNKRTCPKANDCNACTKFPTAEEVIEKAMFILDRQ